MERKTLTILFIDLQGYTSRTARQSRDENDVLVRELRSFIEKHTAKYGGVLRKSMGDGFLLTFESPTDAIVCGQEMQAKIEQRNANVLNKDNFIRFRIGINTGEVTVDEEGDVFGDAVNIASRIQGFAEPNDVYISEATYLAMNRSEIQAQDLGPKMFKNALKEVRVYKVIKGAANAASSIPLVRKKGFPVSALIGIIVAVIGVAVLATFLVARLSKPDIEELWKKNDYAGVLELGDQLIQKDPTNLRVHELMIKSVIKMRDFPRLKDQIREAQEALPNPRALCPPIISFLEQEGNRQLAGNIERIHCSDRPPRNRPLPSQQMGQFQEEPSPSVERINVQQSLGVFQNR